MSRWPQMSPGSVASGARSRRLNLPHAGKAVGLPLRNFFVGMLRTCPEDRDAAGLHADDRRAEEFRDDRADHRQRRIDLERVEDERQGRGQKRRGREPKPITDTPDDRAQTNFTDPELKIMKTNNKGWDYCGNAQVVVDDVCQIIVACDVSAASNDKEQAVPLAQAALANLAQAGIARPTDAAGQAVAIPNLTDSG